MKVNDAIERAILDYAGVVPLYASPRAAERAFLEACISSHEASRALDKFTTEQNERDAATDGDDSQWHRLLGAVNEANRKEMLAYDALLRERAGGT